MSACPLAARGEQTAPTAREEEADWLPNPYQEIADAQVLAGAWPGAQLLLGGLAAPQAFEALPQFPEVGLLPELLVQPQEQEHFLEGWLLPSWGFAAWQPESCPAAELQAKCGASLESASTDGGDAAEAAATESSEGPSEGSAGAEQPAEGEDGSSCGTSSSSTGPSAWKLSHRCVPKGTDLAERFGQQRGASSSDSRGVADSGDVTTLMLRNIPNAYTRNMLVEELEFLGFRGEYDFLYLPIDKSTQWNVGYAFVNFLSPQAAQQCIRVMTGYVFTCFEHASGKVTQISAAFIQGLEKNLEYYSKTAVHCAGSAASRPLVLLDGQNEAPELTRKSSRRRRRQQRGERHPAA